MRSQWPGLGLFLWAPLPLQPVAPCFSSATQRTTPFLAPLPGGHPPWLCSRMSPGEECAPLGSSSAAGMSCSRHSGQGRPLLCFSRAVTSPGKVRGPPSVIWGWSVYPGCELPPPQWLPQSFVGPGVTQAGWLGVTPHSAAPSPASPPTSDC